MKLMLIQKEKKPMRYPEPESGTVELKREVPNNTQIFRTIIGFCNSHGGKLVIGVTDDRNIIGLSEKTIEDAMEMIDKAIFDACSPHIIPRLYVQRFGEKAVLIVEVSEGMNKPYYRRSEGIESGVYIRLGRHTVRATSEIIQELKWQSSGIDFERLPVFQATLEDLDEASIQNFLKNRKNHGSAGIDDRILVSYNIVSYDQSRKYPSTLGILLFGRNPQLYFSEAMIICSHFSGNQGREALATIDCEGNLFNQFQQAFDFIKQRIYRSFTIKHLKRSETLEIPEVAVREVLLNIIVHRNYHIKAPAKIAIYDDRIEFFSPGQFPGPISIENLRVGITYLRNPAICKILREAKYVEKLGSGFITLFESYEKKGLKMPQVIEGDNYVKCILPRVKEKTILHKEDSDLIKIKELFNISHEITVRDVIQKLSISKPTAVRRLNDMIKKGLIERVGHTKNICYRRVK
jgi:ATP-dependent DNA helicase RecG